MRATTAYTTEVKFTTTNDCDSRDPLVVQNIFRFNLGSKKFLPSPGTAADTFKIYQSDRGQILLLERYHGTLL